MWARGLSYVVDQGAEAVWKGRQCLVQRERPLGRGRRSRVRGVQSGKLLSPSHRRLAGSTCGHNNNNGYIHTHTLVVVYMMISKQRLFERMLTSLL